MPAACVHIPEGAAGREVGCIIMRYFIRVFCREMLIQEQAHQQYSGHRGNDRKSPAAPLQTSPKREAFFCHDCVILCLA